MASFGAVNPCAPLSHRTINSLACRDEARLRARSAPAGEVWSGRRGSNPRPTAWKAVTLPLSYSRLRAARSAFRHFGGQARYPLKPLPDFRSRPSRRLFAVPLIFPPSPTRKAGLPTVACLRAKRYGERRLVAREGFEPSKPLGRQIYSLLRLTASLPRQYPGLHVSTAHTEPGPETGKGRRSRG